MKNKLILLLFLPLFNYAQTAFQNNGCAIYVQQNGLIHVQGDFVNANADSSASVKNDGTIEIKGNFENRTGASFGVHTNDNSKERVVKFIGDGKQYIRGDMAQPGKSAFYNLVVDKMYSTDTVEMQAPVAVAGSLVFGTANVTTSYNPTSTYTNSNQKGLIKTYSDSLGEFLLDVQNGSPDAISGYPVLELNGMPNTGYVLNSGIRGTDKGGLERKINSATSYVFPVGTQDKGFNGVRLNFSQVPGDGAIKMKFCSGTSNPDGHVGRISQFCVGCDASNPATNPGYNRYFPANECNGGVPQWLILENTARNFGYWSFESSNQGYEYDMEVFPSSVDGMDLSRTWRVIKHEAEYGNDPSREEVDWTGEIDTLISNPNDLLSYTRNAGCYNGTGIPGGHYKNFSHFTLGMGGSGGALPVELMYVKAEPAGKHTIKVSWATALEINNRGFHVMRSTDAINFSEVGWVDGHNNSTVVQTYAFDDRPEKNMTYYYRLKQMDYDGAFAFSNIVEAKLVSDESEFKVYPNPTNNDLLLEVMNPVDEVAVKMFDITGQMVFENIFTVEENGVAKTFTIKASDALSKGSYILTASTNGARHTAKVVLQ